MPDSFTIEIQARPAKVWAALLDVERWPEWDPVVTSVKRLDSAPLAIGGRTEIHQPKLKPAVWQVTELNEATGLFTWISNQPGVSAVASHQIEPTPTGSRVTLTLQFTGLLGPLVARLLRKQNNEYIAAEANGLKAYCER